MCAIIKDVTIDVGTFKTGVKEIGSTIRTRSKRASGGVIKRYNRLTTSENAGDEEKRTTAGCQGQSDHQELLSTSGVKEKDVVLIIKPPTPRCY